MGVLWGEPPRGHLLQYAVVETYNVKAIAMMLLLIVAAVLKARTKIAASGLVDFAC